VRQLQQRGAAAIAFMAVAVARCAREEQASMKRPKWSGDSRATKADKQKKARQQTDQRMKHQDAQSRGDSNVTRDDPAARMVLSPDDPMAKARKNTARVKK
jgi:hypothetical protein